MSASTDGSPVQVIEQEALSKVHQFFDEFETKAKAFLGDLSGDAKELFGKLRGQVHSDVTEASAQAKVDIVEGKADLSKAEADMTHQPADEPTPAGQVPSTLRVPDAQPEQGTGVGQPLRQDPGTPSA